MSATGEGSLYERWKPEGFFEVRVHDQGLDPTLLALCASFDAGAWRAEAFVDYLFDYVPEFALSYSELKNFHSGTGRALLRKAALIMYQSDKYRRRGEFGELILHAALREVLNTEPAISKVFFKGSVDETVHGFDCVHIAHDGTRGLQLLLGEVKFYADVSSAISAVVGELEDHLGRDYMRDECMLIANRLDPQWPHAAALKKLISERRPLDEIFGSVRIPVLLTYESKSVAGHTAPDAAYLAALETEVRSLHARFASKTLPKHVSIDFILVPLLNKAAFVGELDRKLKIWQQL